MHCLQWQHVGSKVRDCFSAGLGGVWWGNTSSIVEICIICSQFDNSCTITKEIFWGEKKSVVIAYEAGVTYNLKTPVNYEGCDVFFFKLTKLHLFSLIIKRFD